MARVEQFHHARHKCT